MAGSPAQEAAARVFPPSRPWTQDDDFVVGTLGSALYNCTLYTLIYTVQLYTWYEPKIVSQW